MKVVHGIAWYAPESWGGTEQYVAGLAASLASIGISSQVLAPASRMDWLEYEHFGTPVARHPRWPLPERREKLSAWFGASGADAFHLHSWTPECGFDELAAARDAGLATFLTVHIPGPVCARGTMLRWGSKPCDGEIREQRCAACWMQSNGVPAMAARAIAALPARQRPHPPTTPRWLRAFSARADMRQRRRTIERIVEVADRVIAVCAWLHDALLRNGVPMDRLCLSRQAVDTDWISAVSAQQRRTADELRILCAGRWDSTKGQHVLADAMRHVRDSRVRLKFAAPAPATPESARYRDEVMRATAHDSRVEFHTPVDRRALAADFAAADVLAVPSQWFETGPLVVLEAKVARVPVLGSALGGIAELVRPGVDGWLVPHHDVRAWASFIEQIANGRLTASMPVEPVRSMDSVAREMAALYGSRRTTARVAS